MYSAYAPDASDMTLATPVHQTVVDESDFTGDLPPFQDSNAVFSMSAPEITPAPYYPVNAYSGFAPTAAAPSNYVAAAPAPSEQQYSSNPATTTYTSNASYSPSSATGYYDSPSAATAGAETPTPAGADQSFAPMSMLRGSSGTHMNLLAVQDMYASAAVDPLAAGGKPYHPSSAHYYAAPQQQHQQQQYPQYPQYQQQPVSQASRKAEPWTGDVPSYPRQPVPNQTQPYYVFDSAASSVMAPAAAPTPTTTTTAAPAPRQIPAPVQVQPALPLQQQARGASGEAFFLTSPGPISEGLVTPSTFGSGALYGASSLALPTPAPHTAGHATGDYVHAPPHSAMGSSAVSPYDDGQSTLSSASPSGYPSMSLEFRSIPADASVLTSPSASSSSSSSAASAASASALSSPVPVPVSAPIETMRAKRSAPDVQDDDAYDGTVAFPASRSSASTSASSYAGAMVPSSSSRSSGGASSLSMQYAAAAAAAAAAVPLAKSRVAESRMPGNQKPRVNDKEAMRRVHLNEQIAEIRDLIQYDSKRQDKVSILQAASAALRALEFELATLEKQARRPSAADLAGLRTADPMAVAHPVPGGTGSALDFFAQTRVRINHRSAFELSSAPMCIAEVGGGFVDVNRALLEMWGYSREDLIGKPCCTYAHPDDMVNIVTNITQLFTGRHKAVTVMKRVRHASGRWMGFRSVTWIVQGEDDVDVDPATGKKRRVAQYLQSMLFPVAWKMDSVEEVPAASPTAAAAACGSAASGSGSANSCAQPSLEEL